MTPPIIAPHTLSIATVITKLESKASLEAYMKKLILSAKRSPIKKPALAPVAKVLIYDQRLQCECKHVK